METVTGSLAMTRFSWWLLHVYLFWKWRSSDVLQGGGGGGAQPAATI